MSFLCNGEVVMYYKDEHDRVFQIIDGRAYFANHVLEKPPTRRFAAAQEEIDLFHERRILVWKQVEENMGLAFKVAFHMGLDEEAVYAVGIKALVRAVRSYDPEKSKFSTYAWNALRREYNAYRCQSTREVHLPEHMDFAYTEQETDDSIQYILNKLSEYDRTLLILYYLKGFTYEQIANAFGVAKGTIHTHMQKALRRAYGWATS
jgi:RNA polymerase sigma factor (sigma-70 family)